ncbi:MAG: hypothetical protein KAJ14_05340, partial [Candidatus Omnitrophica bacterium]|nr:hypothetical protein [Candidatus Omnitrophota bacterium]
DFSDEILKADFALLPEDTRPRGRFKSKNKPYTAWSLGMPVATNPQEVKRFLDPKEREKEAQFRLAEIREKFDVKKSVEEFKQLIEQIKKQKRNES